LINLAFFYLKINNYSSHWGSDRPFQIRAIKLVDSMPRVFELPISLYVNLPTAGQRGEPSKKLLSLPDLHPFVFTAK